MKKYIAFMLLLALTIYACKKADQIFLPSLGEDKGCIERITIPVTSHGTLSASDYSLIQSLFSTNGITNPNYRYTRTYGDNVYRNVYIIQYANGLPIFIESLNYLFKNGVYNSFAGHIYKGTTLNTSPTLTLGQLRKLFIDDIESHDHNGDHYKDICLSAEFGYSDLNAGSGNKTENIVKSWHLTPKGFDYPEAYYKDEDGALIGYFNGIITN